MEIVKEWWPLFLAGGALLLATIIAVKYKIPLMLTRIGSLEKISHKQEVSKMDMADVVRKEELYKDGIPIYQHAANCKDMQKEYQHTVCVKVDEVKLTVNDMKKVLKALDESVQRANTKLAVVMTRVEDSMKSDRTKDMERFAKLIVKEINRT